MQRSRIVFLKFFWRVYRANILFYLWFFTFICFSRVNPLVSEVGHKIPWSRFKDLKLRQIKPEVTSTIRGGNSKTQQSAANLDFCLRKTWAAFLWSDLDQDQWSKITQILCIRGTEEPTLVMDSLVSLMHHDPSDLGSPILIQITLKGLGSLNLLQWILCGSSSYFYKWTELL